MLHEGQLQLPNNHQPCVQWVHKESLQFATSFETNGKLAISIQELQPTSDPLSLTAKIFPVPSIDIDGAFSFSPISFHASFVNNTEVVVFDVQGSKILFHTKTTEPLYNSPGHFSPDGSFLACEILDHNIHIWKNTPTGYVPWSTLQLRSQFDDFSFSPTTISVLTWGQKGIQVLHPESSVSSPSHNEIKPLYRGYLMACSVDGARMVIAQRDGSVVTVINPHLGTMIQSIHVGVEIQAIGIVDDTILVAGGHRLTCWNLGVEGATISGCHDITAISESIGQASRLVSSNDCSQIVFASEETAILYNITSQSQAVLIDDKVDSAILDVQFSQDGNWLYVCICKGLSSGDHIFHLTKFEMGGDGCSVSMTQELLEDRESWERFFPPSQRYQVTKSKWVVDPSGCNCLWLPPHWRAYLTSAVRFEHNFLALVGGHHQKPIIIELQPLPHSPLTRLPNISAFFAWTV